MSLATYYDALTDADPRAIAYERTRLAAETAAHETYAAIRDTDPDNPFRYNRALNAAADAARAAGAVDYYQAYADEYTDHDASLAAHRRWTEEHTADDWTDDWTDEQ